MLFDVDLLLPTLLSPLLFDAAIEVDVAAVVVAFAVDGEIAGFVVVDAELVLLLLVFVDVIVEVTTPDDEILDSMLGG